MNTRTGQLILLAASVGASLAMFEVVLRVLLGTPVHFRHPQETYISEPVIGHWLEPSQSSFTHHQPVSVNRIGLRDREYPREVSEGRFRLLALGDSQTFGNGLAIADAWPKQLESAIPDTVEVVNAGISGTDTWQHEWVLERVSQSYDFDGVLLAFYVNDVTPRYEPRSAEQITNTWQKRMGYILKRSALFALVWQTYQSKFANASAGDREHLTLTGEPDATVDRGWQQVEASLSKMSASLSRRGVPFAVVVLPRRDQVSADEPPRSYNDRIGAITHRLGIPTLDVLEDLRSAYADHGQALFIPWDGHNSALANRVISDRIARELPRLLPLAAPKSTEASRPARSP